ncbi:hypothetical protein [Parasphingopyxis sp.]|uniref:hypothetical protein n=1 Tax=Parasphingopyxis sp. TaxID=1920299 RepID=UPI00260B1BDA|nr:hypothetical protein [Parasphingopyxis sp.]
MKKLTIALVSGAALALAACAGGEEAATDDTEATEETEEAGEEEEATAAGAYDPASAEGMAYRAAVECSATMMASSDLVGSQGIFADTDEERAEIRADEDDREARAGVIMASAVEMGEALGLSAADVEAEITEHQGTFVQGREDGSMEEFTARVASDADACEAELG